MNNTYQIKISQALKFLSSGQILSAKAEIQQLVDQSIAEQDLMYVYALCEVASKNYASAINYLSKEITEFPNNNAANQLLQELISEQRIAAQNQHTHTEKLSMFIEIFNKLYTEKKWEDALKLSDQLVTSIPSHNIPDLHYHRAQCLIESKQYFEAVSEFNQELLRTDDETKAANIKNLILQLSKAIEYKKPFLVSPELKSWPKPNYFKQI